MRRSVLMTLTLLPLAGPALADEVDKQQAAAMAPLAWMAGEWKGESTMRRPEGQLRSLSWERVIVAAGGTALLIQGRHHAIKPDGTPGDVVHDAAGLLSFQPRTGKHRFVAQLANGRSGDFEARVEGDKLLWSMPAGEGQQIRYEIQRNAAGQWAEEGFFCRGESCQPFFKMTLTKQP
ncbi:hypothetical protein [Roseateles asaccharophilus]|uniref:DUF1579 domain-containing protein n=1 Tax=Roseateles asaccharophilus TaxID=582607 RepID=A0ABU2A637_9BURK|nr:hypothetical protein [Roseateles asaccharophilus]MDR7332659.1 hypothetical protein [Roseateles asaccharophilus]